MLIQSENPPFRRPILDLSIATFNEECDEASNEASGICSLPELIDFNAAHNPHPLFCLQEERENGEHGSLTSLTFLGVQKAIYAAAASLRKITSASLKTSQQPVALLLESDVTLFVYLSALLYMDIPVSSHECTPIIGRSRSTQCSIGPALVHPIEPCGNGSPAARDICSGPDCLAPKQPRRKPGTRPSAYYGPPVAPYLRNIVQETHYLR